MKYLVVVEPPEGSDLVPVVSVVDAPAGHVTAAAETAAESYPIGTVVHVVEKEQVVSYIARLERGARVSS